MQHRIFSAGSVVAIPASLDGCRVLEPEVCTGKKDKLALPHLIGRAAGLTG